jgi:hypothetical protein
MPSQQQYRTTRRQGSWRAGCFLFRCKSLWLVGTAFLMVQCVIWLWWSSREGRTLSSSSSLLLLLRSSRDQTQEDSHQQESRQHKLPDIIPDLPVDERPGKADDDMSPGQALHFVTTYGIKTFSRSLANVTSMEAWEQIAPFVKSQQRGSFCLGWENRSQHASDLWWTHHPDWGVFNETDEGYCYRPHPDELQREYMASIYQHQFQHVTGCSNLFITRMWSSGWSADMYNLVYTLQYAMMRGQPMEITDNPWHYAAPDQAGRSNSVPSPPACPLLTMYCYFLPLSACPIQTRGTHNQDYDYRHPPLLPPRAHRWLPSYVARPQTWLRHEVFRFLQDQQQRHHQLHITATILPSNINTTAAPPCTVLHVRRADVIQHGNQSRRYHALSEYLDVVRDKIIPTTLDSSDHHPPHSILLLTDDANVIVESQSFSLLQEDKPQNSPRDNNDDKHNNNTDQKMYHWMFIDRPRFHADEGGWEHQLPSSRPIFEMIVLWATFAWVKHCTSIVHATSGFSDWLIWEMKKVHGEENELKTYNLDKDVPLDQIYSEHNAVLSKNMSTVR